MQKTETIKQILAKLISRSNVIGRYTQRDIENTIIEVRGADPRTINNWFKVLLRLDYLLQPEPNLYSLNIDKIAALELPVKVPVFLDKNQTKLGVFC